MTFAVATWAKHNGLAVATAAVFNRGVVMHLCLIEISV